MVTVNIHEAKTQLSKLVDRAAKGEPFVIAKSGKPLVKVVALDAPKARRRLGFLKGEFKIRTISTAWAALRSRSCSAWAGDGLLDTQSLCSGSQPARSALCGDHRGHHAPDDRCAGRSGAERF